ncbi:Peptidyl-prolyl cis-trans isomerase cyp15 [Aspergillus fumigatus]
MADTGEQAKLAVNKRPHAAIEDEEDGFQEMDRPQTMTLVLLYHPPMRRRKGDASYRSRRST